MDKLEDVIEKARQLAKGQPSPALPDIVGSTPVATNGNRRHPPVAPRLFKETPLVKFLQIERRLDGRFSVQIGEREPIEVPNSLAQLIAALAADVCRQPCGRQRSVRWMEEWETIVAKLGLSNNHAASERIYRLRKLLLAHGIYADLVQTGPLGARFGLDRKGARVIEGDAP